MKIKTSSLCWMLAVTGAVLPFATPAMAQSTVTPGVAGRLSVVELKDATLADALELIFKSAGNPSHIIDDSAQTIQIPSVTLNNIAWDAAVRNLANLNGFKVSRNGSGAWIVEPRAPLITDGVGPDGMPISPMGSQFQGGFPGGMQGGGSQPVNPFGNRNQSNFDIRTFSNSQTRPNFGGRGGTTGTTGTGATTTEAKEYKIIIVRHIYAGGLAQLFNNSSIIRTEDFVSPGETNSNGNGNGGGFGNNNGGGFGNNGGGFGNNGGSSFGGGIGGIGGGSGFGGGGFGGGGFGGGSSFGGGGFGGGFGF